MNLSFITNVIYLQISSSDTCQRIMVTVVEYLMTYLTEPL